MFAILLVMFSFLADIPPTPFEITVGGVVKTCATAKVEEGYVVCYDNNGVDVARAPAASFGVETGGSSASSGNNDERTTVYVEGTPNKITVVCESVEGSQCLGKGNELLATMSGGLWYAYQAPIKQRQALFDRSTKHKKTSSGGSSGGIGVLVVLGFLAVVVIGVVVWWQYFVPVKQRGEKMVVGRTSWGHNPVAVQVRTVVPRWDAMHEGIPEKQLTRQLGGMDSGDWFTKMGLIGAVIVLVVLLIAVAAK